MFTQDEIIKMAELADAYADVMDVGGKNYSGLRDEFFAKLVAEKAVRESSAEYRLGWNDGQIAEREACAKICEETVCKAQDSWDRGVNTACTELARAIRARGEAQ